MILLHCFWAALKTYYDLIFIVTKDGCINYLIMLRFIFIYWLITIENVLTIPCPNCITRRLFCLRIPTLGQVTFHWSVEEDIFFTWRRNRKDSGMTAWGNIFFSWECLINKRVVMFALLVDLHLVSFQHSKPLHLNVADSSCFRKMSASSCKKQGWACMLLYITELFNSLKSSLRFIKSASYLFFNRPLCKICQSHFSVNLFLHPTITWCKSSNLFTTLSLDDIKHIG